MRPAAERLDPGDGLARVRAAEQRHVRPGLGERERGPLPKAAAAARHQCDLAVKPEAVEDHAHAPAAACGTCQ